MNAKSITLSILSLWVFSGIYMVRVDEQGVVRRFGAVIADHVSPGLHLGLPLGIDCVDRVKVREQKRLSVGFELADPILGRPANPAEHEFFTGDQNLVNLELLVQYTVREPRNYLFSTPDLPGALRRAVESAVTETLGSEPVDGLLTTSRLAIQEHIRRQAQASADSENLGISLTAVNIQSVSPPLAVADAFRDVASAREDKERLVNEAESYANAALPAANAQAASMKEEAIGYQDGKVREAHGDADRFNQAYGAYRLSPDITRARLYLEAVESILPKLKIIHIDHNQSPIDLNLIPRLSSAPAQSQSAAPPPGGAAIDSSTTGSLSASGAPATSNPTGTTSDPTSGANPSPVGSTSPSPVPAPATGVPPAPTSAPSSTGPTLNP